MIMDDVTEQRRIACGKDDVTVALQAHHESSFRDRAFNNGIDKATIGRSAKDIVGIA